LKDAGDISRLEMEKKVRKQLEKYNKQKRLAEKTKI